MNDDVRMKMVSEMQDAIKGGNVEEFANKVVELNDDLADKMAEIRNEIVNEFETFKATQNAPKGFRPCSKEEQEWLDKVIETAKNSTDGSTAPIEKQMPLTVMDEIFQYIEDTHELINELNFINTKGKVRWFHNSGITGAAGWGQLTAAITEEIKSGFVVEEVGLFKLSAFSYIALDWLDLGYEWLMRYVVRVLAEAIAEALEDGVVNGNGTTKPAGMIMDKDVDEDGVITYEEKTPIAITAFNPAQMGDIYATLAVGRNGKTRPVKNVICVVNSLDYYKKIIPAVMYRNALGEYVQRTPLPVKFVISEQVETNTAVLGMGKLYDLLLGLGKDGKMQYSDEFKFLDDVRTIKQKVLANGLAKDNNAFVVLDIENLKPDYFNVKAFVEESSM